MSVNTESISRCKKHAKRRRDISTVRKGIKASYVCWNKLSGGVKKGEKKREKKKNVFGFPKQISGGHA